MWSPAPISVIPTYHKIWGLVKSSAQTPRSWGSMGGHINVGKMKGKLRGGPGRVWIITVTPTLAHIASDYDDWACGADADSGNLSL
jgi:hypothetical protein